MAKPLDALDYIAHPEKHDVPAVVAVFGDEAFLKRQVLKAVVKQVVGNRDGDFSVTHVDGDEANWRDISDELSTMSLFGGGRRLVVIDDADGFVSKNRPAFEVYVAHPRASGALMLSVGTWPSNTRLFKALAESGLQIECKFPPPARLLKWLTGWAKSQHGVQLDPAGAEAMNEIIEPELGLFDQELAKLAALAGQGGVISPELVHEAVGGWRSKTVWEMLDAAAAGDARQALLQLEHLLSGGEAPIAVLAQISGSLRRFAAATRIIEEAESQRRRITLRDALGEAGIKPFALGKAEAQLRQIGRVRGAKLYDWLLEADLALKGSSSAPARARMVLEQLIARLAKTANPPAIAGASSR
jgi:DNA polymerase-3 subunit delta